MKVEVRLYGALRRYRPAGAPANQLSFLVELPPDSTIDELSRHLGIADGFVSAAAVNDEAVESSAGLHDGDRVGLFPPSAGG
jgi:molybdopterin converting factor small subunit